MIITDLAERRAALSEVFSEAERLCFFTGAGISTESGIPDFRSPGGIWSTYRIVELQDFLNSEEARLEDWKRRFHMAELFAGAEPNAAHKAIASCCTTGQGLGVITQNIDGLHARAGVPDEKLVLFHGTGAYAHCLSCAQRYEIADMQKHVEAEETAPMCRYCGGLVKAAVVSFGEAIPSDVGERALAMTDACDVMIAIGSSLQVWPAAGLVERAHARGAVVIIINNEATPLDGLADKILRGGIRETFENLP